LRQPHDARKVGNLLSMLVAREVYLLTFNAERSFANWQNENERFKLFIDLRLTPFEMFSETAAFKHIVS